MARSGNAHDRLELKQEHRNAGYENAGAPNDWPCRQGAGAAGNGVASASSSIFSSGNAVTLGFSVRRHAEHTMSLAEMLMHRHAVYLNACRTCGVRARQRLQNANHDHVTFPNASGEHRRRRRRSIDGRLAHRHFFGPALRHCKPDHRTKITGTRSPRTDTALGGVAISQQFPADQACYALYTMIA